MHALRDRDVRIEISVDEKRTVELSIYHDDLTAEPVVYTVSADQFLCAFPLHPTANLMLRNPRVPITAFLSATVSSAMTSPDIWVELFPEDLSVERLLFLFSREEYTRAVGSVIDVAQ
jgi:hypothetical protein